MSRAGEGHMGHIHSMDLIDPGQGGPQVWVDMRSSQPEDMRHTPNLDTAQRKGHIL